MHVFYALLTSLLGEIVRYLGSVDEVDNDGQDVVGALLHLDDLLLLSHGSVNDGLEVFRPSTDEVAVKNMETYKVNLFTVTFMQT